MADYAQRYADTQADKLSGKIAKTYARAAKEIKGKMDSFWAAHKVKADKMLKDVADGKITKQDYQNWLRNQVFQGDKWKNKLDDMTQAYIDADKKAREMLGDTAKNVFMEAGNYQAYQTGIDVNGAVSFDMYDRKTVDKLIRDDPQLLPEWKINEPKDYQWNYERVNNAVTQGILQGESVYDIGKRLTNDLSARNASKMDMFARTAVTGAQNAGRIERLHEAQDMGIKVKKRWLAAHDDRVRDAHADLDGVEVDVDQPFHNELGDIMYPGDPSADPGNVYNCRCTLIYVYPEYDNKQENNDIEAVQGEEDRTSEYESANNDKQNDEQNDEQITLDDIWKPSGDYVPANSQKEFMMNNMAELKAAGVKNSAQIREQYENTAMQTAFERLHKISDQEAVDIARDGIPEGIRNKWFVDADSSVKPKIVDCLMGDPELLNSGWNIAYRNYIETIGNSNVSFEEFMGTPIKMFRGTHGQSEIASDVWVSFSMDRKIAESFGDSIEEILIRPIDTWGSYQTTAEAEILVPKRMLDKLRD